MRTRLIASLTASAAILSITCAAQATIIRVPDDHATIQLGVWNATPGDTVLVECGTYNETLIFFQIDDVTLLSETGEPTCVTIDGGGQDHVFVVFGATGVVIDGFTVTGGVADFGGGARIDSSDVLIRDCVFRGNAATIEGGGIWWRKGTPDIRDCDFEDNDAANSGGGLCLNSTDGDVDGCYFYQNEARWGGGMAVYHTSTTTINGCTFTENGAVGGDAYGGGLYTWNGTDVTIVTCGFYRNTSEYCGGGACSDTDCEDSYFMNTFDTNAASFGGGFYAWGNDGGSIDACSFYDNTAAFSGGGALFEEVTGATLMGSLFEGNSAGTAGGGIAFEDCSWGPSTCVFVSNQASYGGAVAVEESDGGQTVFGCTMVLNGLSGGRTSGTGIAVGDNAGALVTQTIIAFSESGEAVAVVPGSAVTLTTCDLYANPGGNWVGVIADQLPLRHNMESDPNFCGLHADWYDLCADSPCLPGNNGAGLRVGAYGHGCDACGSPVEARTWGAIKALYH